MRWSLILFTSVAVLSTLSVALVIPTSESPVDLERRARKSVKASSKIYRGNAKDHGFAYLFSSNGRGVTSKRLSAKGRLLNGQTLAKLPKTDADHIFEHQLFMAHLNKHRINYGDLHPDLKEKASEIFNGPQNMALIPAHINRRKGQVFKHALRGVALVKSKPGNPAHHQVHKYIKVSYPSALKTAKDLDEAFKDHDHDFGHDGFQNTLHKAMIAGKIPMHDDQGRQLVASKPSRFQPPRAHKAVVRKAGTSNRRSARIAQMHQNSSKSKKRG